MILGALCMVVANAAVLLGAHALLDRLRSGKPAADLALFLILRFLIVSAAVLVAGLMRCFTPLVLGGAGAVALALLISAGAHRRLPRWSAPAWGAGWTLLFAAVFLRLLLQVWFFAPYLGDSLAYHLPKIAEWVRGGGFTGEMGIDPRSTFPAGFELIEAWWVVYLHHDVLIEMAGVEFYLLAVVSVYALADALGWGSRAATAAAALFALNPATVFQATSAANDGAVTALVLATAALIAAGSPPLLLLLPVAMGAGIKPTYLYALPGLVLLQALLPRGEGGQPAARRTTVALGVVSLFVGSFWYVRNFAIYGNPIHPMGPGGMKSLVSGSTLQRIGPSVQSLRENLTCFLDIRIYDAQMAPDALCTGTFGWGPAGFALGALALIPVLRAERLMRRLALAFAASALCIFTLVELDLWYNRFVVFLAALPALALARLWDRHRFVPVLGSLALLLQFAETTVPGNLAASDLRAMLRSGWRERAVMRPPPEADGHRLAFTCDDFGAAYPLYRPDYGRGLVYLREQTTDDLLATIDREGVTLLYTSAGLPRRRGIFEEAVRRGRLVPVTHGIWKGYEVVPRR